MNMSQTSQGFILIILCLSITKTLTQTSSRYSILRRGSPNWISPGCHKVGHTRQISIPDCVKFKITTNACRGYCESYTIPSTEETLAMNSEQVITSIAQCCTITETEDVKVDVLCVDGLRELTFKSAKTCDCFVCMKD